MRMQAEYVLALTTGLLGGFGHCIGMCGPIVASYSLAQKRTEQGVPYLSHALYNAGRIITYGCIGAVMGTAGSFVNVAGRIAGIQNLIAVLSGIIMIIMGLNITGIWGTSAWIERQNAPVLGAARRILSSSSLFRFLWLGLVLGLLPCGLSYTIFMAAAGTGNAAAGMVTAVLFGVGTLPALFLFGSVISSLSVVLRGRIYRAGGMVVIITGFYFVIRGIRLYADL